MKLSKSKIESFETCPRLFKYLYIDGRATEVEESLQASIGKLFHNFAYSFFDMIDDVKLIELYNLSDVKQYFLRLIPKELPEPVKELCRNFCEFEALHWTSVRNINTEYFFPLARELRLETERFSGKIDRIDKLVSGNAIVIEYKTTPDWNLRKLRRELTFYASLVNSSKVLENTVTQIGCYNAYLNRWWHSDISIHTIRALERRVVKILKEKKFPRKLSGACRHCPFARECLYERD